MNRYFLQPFEIDINKSKEETNQRIPIRIEASSPTVDKQKDLILLKAYTKPVIDEFLKFGIIDYDHRSIIGKTSEEKASAVIGEPTNFKIEKSKHHNDMEVPVIYGDLYKENLIVKSSLLPALKAASTRWGASIGGNILKSKEIIKSDNKTYREISEIKINHCAITPTLKAVNNFTSVSMVKSAENFIEFMKAIVTGAETDITNITGGQALQRQSIEDGKVSQVMPSLLYIMTEFKKAKINKTIPDLDNLLFRAINFLDYKLQQDLIKAVNKNKELIYNLV